MTRILHLITSLNTGGAELMLLKLLSGLDSKIFSCSVVSLIPSGPVGEKIRDLNVPVKHLGLSRGGFSPGAFFALSRTVIG